MLSSFDLHFIPTTSGSSLFDAIPHSTSHPPLHLALHTAPLPRSIPNRQTEYPQPKATLRCLPSLSLALNFQHNRFTSDLFRLPLSQLNCTVRPSSLSCFCSPLYALTVYTHALITLDYTTPHFTSLSAHTRPPPPPPSISIVYPSIHHTPPHPLAFHDMTLAHSFGHTSSHFVLFHFTPSLAPLTQRVGLPCPALPFPPNISIHTLLKSI